MVTINNTPKLNEANGDRWIWMFPVSAFRWFWVPFALHLQDRIGCKALLIVPTAQDRRFYCREAGDALSDDQFAVMPDLLATASEGGDADEARLIEWASAYEKRFNVNMMRDIVQSDRHLGRGFMPGWNLLPGSHAADKSTQASTLRACFNQSNFYEELATSHPPALAVAHGGGTGVSNKHVPLLCREREAPFRSLSMGRIGSFYYWAQNEFEDSDELESQVRLFRDVTSDEVEAVRNDITPTTASSALKRTTTHQQALRKGIREVSRVLLEQAYMRVRGYSKFKHGYKSISKAYSCLRTYSDWRYLNRPDCLTLEELPNDRNIVYFPLQTEPEASIQGQSPECTNQSALIHEIALSLPANALLVVKEHPMQIGRRPRDMYERVKAMPNAVLVSPGESSLDLISRSRLTCAINSSAAYEAAMLGKTVAIFGHHGPIRAIPHVHRVNISECQSMIPRLLVDEGPEAVARKKIDGARAYYAIRTFCMDLTSLNMYGGQSTPPDAELRVLSDALLESVSTKLQLAS